LWHLKGGVTSNFRGIYGGREFSKFGEGYDIRGWWGKGKDMIYTGRPVTTLIQLALRGHE
jgi:hypothetical protein